MLSTLQILLPVFGLVLAGFACRRRGVLGSGAASELNRFVVRLALPALLFDIMAHATWQQFYQPGRQDGCANSTGALTLLRRRLQTLFGRSFRLEVRSEIGEGTTVTMRIPLQTRFEVMGRSLENHGPGQWWR